MPADLGLKDWSQYNPPALNAPDNAVNANNRKVFIALYHYEWLKYTNEVARPSLEYGLMSQPICNPETMYNGTDLYWLMRLANVRGFAAEWWNSAMVTVATYYNGRYYDNVAKKNDKEIIFLGESAAAGGNPYYDVPNYWDNQANYLITYGQAGSIDAKAKHDQYWGSSWKSMVNPEHPEYQSYTAFKSAWCGFLQNRNDQAWKPHCDVLAISNRSIMHNIAAFDWSSGQPYNLGETLVRLNYLHDGAGFPLDDAINLDDYKVVLYSPFEAPQGYVEKLAKWVQEKSDRVVVTHGFVPARHSAPGLLGATPVDAILPGTQAAQLGLGSLTQISKRSGVLSTTDPIFKQALGAMAGQVVTFSSGLYKAADGKTLVQVDSQPLVSEYNVGKGRVIYLHFAPNEHGINGSKVQTAIVNAVMSYLKQKPAGYAPENFRTLTYDRANGARAYIIQNQTARTDALYKGNVRRVFQAQDPNVKATVRLLFGAPEVKVRITDMITEKSEIVTTDRDGYLTVDCNGWNMRGLYADPM